MFKQLIRKNVCRSLLISLVCVGLTVFSLVACAGGSSGDVSSRPTPPPTVISTPAPTPIPSPTAGPVATPSPVPVPTSPTSPPIEAFQVTSIDMVMSPRNMAAFICRTNLIVTYTATFHIVPNSPGGTILFSYTWNNGRAEPRASISIGAGQTTATYSYTWSGLLSGDNVLPGIGGVWTSSPNVIYSSQVGPIGGCKVTAFKVTSIGLTVSPKSLTGLPCGIPPTLTYTATFHIVPNSLGGTIKFSYTGNNGRSSPPASVSISAGQTTATYSYTWLGYVFGDRLVAGVAEVWTSSPNVVYSPQVEPVGRCV